MPILPILIYPDERLRQVAQPVQRFDTALQQLVDDMTETMYAAPGMGLAAVQVNVPKRVVVIDLSEQKDELQVFINPQLTPRTGEIEYEEGCLSVPGVFARVKRIEKVHVRAQDVHGATFELEAEGLLAVCLQHEVDHLDGKVFVDYLSRLKQTRLKNRMKKEAHAAAQQQVA